MNGSILLVLALGILAWLCGTVLGGEAKPRSFTIQDALALNEFVPHLDRPLFQSAQADLVPW
jgi:hypothetical protein